jgi:NDP-sugar pyrophosphorylase family protein
VSETAILVLGSKSLWDSVRESPYFWESQSETPFGCLDILGASLLERTAERLRGHGVSRIWVVAEDRVTRFIPRPLRKRLATIAARADEASVVERIRRLEAATGATTILLMEVGPYIEFDVGDVLRFHCAQKTTSTILCDREGTLPFSVLSAAHRISADVFFASASDGEAAHYVVNGYSNRLSNLNQLRRLITDAFDGRCGFLPRARELYPGVWVGDGARIHRDAQVIPPVYIGSKARLHASAVVSQFSNIEPDSVVGCASKVEHSSVFACTHVGKGLDIFNAIVDGGRVASLHRDVAIEINDPTILSKIEPWRLVRFSRKSAQGARFAAEASKMIAAPSVSPAAVPVYVDSAKERHGQWETCNREAVT